MSLPLFLGGMAGTAILARLLEGSGKEPDLGDTFPPERFGPPRRPQPRPRPRMTLPPAPVYAPQQLGSVPLVQNHVVLGQLQPPPPWGGGTTPPPSEFMGYEQWQRTRAARNALCQLAERYGPDPEVGHEEAYEGMMNVLGQLDPDDVDAALKHAVKRCPELMSLINALQEARRKKREEERIRKFEEEVRQREPVATWDPEGPEAEPRGGLPRPGRPVASPPVYGPRVPQPEYPERIPDVAFRPKVATPGFVQRGREPVEYPAVPTETRFGRPEPGAARPWVESPGRGKPAWTPTPPVQPTAPPVGEPIATGRPLYQSPYAPPLSSLMSIATGAGAMTAAAQGLMPTGMPTGMLAGIRGQYIPSMRGGYSPWW